MGLQGKALRMGVRGSGRKTWATACVVASNGGSPGKQVWDGWFESRWQARGGAQGLSRVACTLAQG